MGMKRIYTCNICRERIDNPVESFGVYFTNLHDFTLGAYGCTDGVHICYRCAKQLQIHLNEPEIVKLINENPTS